MTIKKVNCYLCNKEEYDNDCCKVVYHERDIYFCIDCWDFLECKGREYKEEI